MGAVSCFGQASAASGLARPVGAKRAASDYPPLSRGTKTLRLLLISYFPSSPFARHCLIASSWACANVPANYRRSPFFHFTWGMFLIASARIADPRCPHPRLSLTCPLMSMDSSEQQSLTLSFAAPCLYTAAPAQLKWRWSYSEASWKLLTLDSGAPGPRALASRRRPPSHHYSADLQLCHDIGLES